MANINTYKIPATDGLDFEDMKFVPVEKTEMNPEAIKKIKAFQEKLAFRSLKKFRTEIKRTA